jgi:micrococcal nuclease
MRSVRTLILAGGMAVGAVAVSGCVPGGAPAPPLCDPNYAGACVPVVGYDLDCGDIPVKNFTVVGVDIHGFDADNDTIACEG